MGETMLAVRSRFLRDWPLYCFEGAELAIFMLSACLFTVLLFHPGYAALRLFPSPVVRRTFMGLAMGLTAVIIIHSPIGKRSGAHFNPAITLTYLRLRKIAFWDAVFYVVGQFAGGAGGVGVSVILLGKRLADPAVDYAVTVPGVDGTAAAFAAELFMAALLMSVVPRLSLSLPLSFPWSPPCDAGDRSVKVRANRRASFPACISQACLLRMMRL